MTTGKVYEKDRFIADVQYRHWAERSGTLLQAMVEIVPASAVSGYLGQLLTLHMADGKKQNFYVETSEGLCRGTGGPY